MEDELTRLRREECRRTKHDSIFSPWKVLIGPSDWDDHSLGKDGVERYRTHNLPTSCPCPGLYELGIVATFTDEGQKTRQQALSNIIVVYIGQADNVRARLQQYGRAGSHLDHGNSFSYSKKSEIPSLQRGPGLFKEIFSKGYSIVYRWAPMRYKKQAEKMEEQLLECFDYAWNKRGNGACRREDILSKLNSAATRSNVGLLSKFEHWNRTLFSKKLGIEINAGLPLDEMDSINKRGFLPQIFKFVISRPRLVQLDNSLCQDEEICGVAIGNGCICRNKPVLGRKRCSDHKGKRITGISYVTSRDFRMPQDESPAPDGKLLNPVGGSFYKSKFLSMEGTSNFDQEYETCGVVFGDESVCRSRPVPGRKRCELHEGQRITFPKSLTSKEGWFEKGTGRSTLDKENDICGVVSGDGSVCRSRCVPGRKRCELHKGQRITEPKALTSREGWIVTTGMHELIPTLDDEVNICGVVTDSGHVCRRKPVPRRNRCEMHKGQRITEPKSLTTRGGWLVTTGIYELIPTLDDELNICGVVTDSGHVCRRKPVPGRKRCEEHKGRRITSSGLTSKASSIGTVSLLVCGVYLGDGSVCMNSPVSGRKRCALHKGRRVS